MLRTKMNAAEKVLVKRAQASLHVADSAGLYSQRRTFLAKNLKRYSEILAERATWIRVNKARSQKLWELVDLERNIWDDIFYFDLVKLNLPSE